MRVLALVLLLIPTLANAQTAPEAQRLWRVAASGGLHTQLGTALSLSADRAIVGPLAAGVRTTAFVTGSCCMDDGGSLTGGTADAFVALQTGGRWVRARAFAGLGLGAVDFSSGGLRETPEDLAAAESFSGILGYSVVGLGVDFHLTRSVALGGEYRLDPSSGSANVSTVDLGLRVRL